MKKMLFILFWHLEKFYMVLFFILILIFLMGNLHVDAGPFSGILGIFFSLWFSLMISIILGLVLVGRFYHRLLNWVYDSKYLVPIPVGKYIFIFPIEKLELIFQNAYSKGIVTQYQYNALLYDLYTAREMRRMLMMFNKVEKYYTKYFKMKEFRLRLSAYISITQFLSILHEAYKDNLLSERQQKDFQNILLNRKMCPNCTTESQRDLDFCPVCGSELVEETKYNLDKLL